MVLVLITVGCIQSLNWTERCQHSDVHHLGWHGAGVHPGQTAILPQSLADIPALALGILYAFWQTAVADEGGHVGVLWQHLLTWVQGRALVRPVPMMLFSCCFSQC